MSRAATALIAVGAILVLAGLALLVLPGPSLPLLLAGACVLAVGALAWSSGRTRPRTGPDSSPRP